MKSIYRLLMPAALCGVVMGGCELETSHNGDLDGMWHLQRVDTVATGGVRDMSKERMYWSFQLKLLQLEDKEGMNGRYLFRFSKTKDSLKLSSPYIYDREDGDKPLDTFEPLRPFGVNSLDDRYAIDKLDGSRMRLKNDRLILSFKKF